MFHVRSVVLSLLLAGMSVISAPAISSTMTGVNIMASPAGTGVINQPVVVTAQATGGNSPVYQFWVGDPTATYWTILQDYGSGNSVTWTPTATGVFPLVVRVRESTSTNPYDFQNNLFYTVVASGLRSVSLNTSLFSPQPTKTPITLTASAAGGSAVVFQFLTINSSGTATILQNYSATATCIWTPSVQDTYTVKVFARESTGTQDPNMFAQTSFTINNTTPPLTALTMAVAPTTGIVNQPVTITAQATGGSNLTYQFWVGDPTATYWTLLRDYAASSAINWTSTSVGTFPLVARVRSGGSTNQYDLQSYLFYPVAAPPALSAVSLSVSPASPQPINSAITMTAKPTGGTNVQYQFWFGVANGTAITWSALNSAYQSASTVTWTTSVAGTYHLKVDARETGGQTNVESSDTVYSIISGILGVTLATTPVSPQSTNTTITLTATPTGGVNVQYQFWAGAVTGTAITWSALNSSYQSAATITWKTNAAGSYHLKVDARESGKTVVVESSEMLYNIKPASGLTGVKIAGSPSSPLPINSAITLTATPTGSTSVQYQFLLGTASGTAVNWTVLNSAFQSSTAYIWTAATAGSYQLKVDARQASGQPLFESTAVSYTILPITGTVAAGPLAISGYRGNKKAAVSYTFDDGYQSQIDYAVPALDTYGFKGTFNVIAGFTRNLDTDPQLPATNGAIMGSWQGWKRVYADGQEIGNHSYSHVDIPTLTDPTQIDLQINGSATIDQTNIGVHPFTFAFPYNDQNPYLDSLVLAHHYAIRLNPTEFGNQLYYVSDWNAGVDTAVLQGGWYVPQMHGFLPNEYGSITQSDFLKHLAYVASLASTVWVDTYGNVSRYLQERSAAALEVDAASGSQVTFVLTCPLDPTVFTQPMSITINSGLTKVASATATVVKTGKSLPVTILANGQLLLDVLPGSGQVTVQWK